MGNRGLYKTFLYLVLLLCASSAQAHVSEQAFVLLLPTQAYITGGCLSVLASILIVTLVPKNRLDPLFAPKHWTIPKLPARAPEAVSLLASIALMGLVVIGMIGPRDPLTNLLPLTVWVGVWIIAFNFVGLFGDIWRLINPWTGLHCLIFGQEEPEPLLKLPEKLGVFPAILGFCAMFGFSIVDPAPADPDRLAQIVLFYWLFHFVAMVIFGRSAWITRGEPLSLFFAQISRVSIISYDKTLKIGLLGWQLTAGKPSPWGPAIFGLIILGLGSFDGLKETFWWLGQIGINPLEFPGRTAVILPSLVGMVLSVVALIAAFSMTIFLGQFLGNYQMQTSDKVSFSTMFRALSPTILPIALAFHAAHFTVTFLIDGQYLLAAIGDPLAQGANLFGLGDIRVTTGFLNTMEPVRAIWLTQAGIVVIGHVLAVVMAHCRALEMFKTARAATLSQLPLGAFMILYTLFGLWLLAAPRGV